MAAAVGLRVGGVASMGVLAAHALISYLDRIKLARLLQAPRADNDVAGAARWLSQRCAPATRASAPYVFCQVPGGMLASQYQLARSLPHRSMF